MIKLKTNKIKSVSRLVNSIRYLKAQGYTVAMISSRLGIKESVVHSVG